MVELEIETIELVIKNEEIGSPKNSSVQKAIVVIEDIDVDIPEESPEKSSSIVKSRVRD